MDSFQAAIQSEHGTSPEDTEIIFEILVASSLRAAAFLIAALSTAVDSAELQALVGSVLRVQGLWATLCGSCARCPAVRAGACDLLLAVTQHCGEALEEATCQRNATNFLVCGLAN